MSDFQLKGKKIVSQLSLTDVETTKWIALYLNSGLENSANNREFN